MPRGHYKRYRPNAPAGLVPFEPGRAVGHVVDPISGCWHFTGKKTAKGYGQIHMGPGRSSVQIAHRVYYERAKGPIPAGLQIDHLCKHTFCVNPDHLEPVVNAVNMQRGTRVKLSPEIVRQLRAERIASGESFAVIAKRHGFKKTTVQMAITRLNWTNIE